MRGKWKGLDHLFAQMCVDDLFFQALSLEGIKNSATSGLATLEYKCSLLGFQSLTLF